MKTKKIFALAICALMAMGLAACRPSGNSASGSDNSDSSGGGDTFVSKPVDGTPLLFDEGMAYYNIQPSILYEDESTVHVYYTVNKTANGEDSVIAYRKGVLENGTWNFGEKKVVLEKGASGTWDSNSISNCDVVKGNFSYKNEEYSYLMAYQANDNALDKCYQIGFAVAKTADGEFVKIGTTPVISYDDTALGYAWGVGQPSLVHYDGGKVYLFYTMGDAIATQTYVSEIDASNLENIKGADTYSSVSTEGLLEGNVYTMLNDADFAIDKTNGVLYLVRNYNPAASTAPNLNTAVQVAKVALADLYKPSCTWEVIDEKVNFLDLATETAQGGWERVYSACICSDAYGNVNGATALELGLTVTSWDLSSKAYTYYQTITTYTMTIA